MKNKLPINRAKDTQDHILSHPSCLIVQYHMTSTEVDIQLWRYLQLSMRKSSSCPSARACNKPQLYGLLLYVQSLTRYVGLLLSESQTCVLAVLGHIFEKKYLLQALSIYSYLISSWKRMNQNQHPAGSCSFCT